MIPDRPRLQVLVGDRDLTDRADSLVFSAVDNGGFEIATLGLPSIDRPKKGTPIIIRSGLEVAWAGRVAEIADHSQHGRATKTTGCEGYRALMKDSTMQMVYIDRDLTRWRQWSAARQAALLTAGNNTTGFSWSVLPDATGNPGLQILGAAPLNGKPMIEAWYDAGPGNLVSRIRINRGLAQTYTFPDANNTVAVFSCNTDNAGNPQSSGNFAGATPTVDFTSPVAQRYFDLQHLENIAGPAGAAGTTYGYQLSNISVIGNHGLTLRGASSASDGFYPSDVATHAMSQCKGIVPGTIIQSTGYTAPHIVYRTPVTPDVIIDDMAKLMGWTWGVWEPNTIFGSQPRLDFRPPPADATAVVMKAECDQLDITSRLGDLYDTAQVTYTDTVGNVGIVTVTLTNPQLAEAGLAGRTLQLNMGPGSAAAATTFGNMALALSQNAARAAGQATLPVSVRLPNGGSKPAHLLRPGIDRLRITDLVNGGALFDIGTVRRDVFRISRIETTVAKDGTPSTRVELDSGSNLLDVLQARLSIAAGVVGAGASGG